MGRTTEGEDGVGRRNGETHPAGVSLLGRQTEPRIEMGKNSTVHLFCFGSVRVLIKYLKQGSISVLVPGNFRFSSVLKYVILSSISTVKCKLGYC